MKIARRFEVGKSYQFVGYPIALEEGESMFAKLGALPENRMYMDIEIPQWMDRNIRKCTYTDPLRGFAAAFEGLEVFAGSVWLMPRTYQCYLEAGMFQEVEIE